MNSKLLHTSTKVGTVHEFQLPGGKSEFTRFLASHLGSSKFCETEEEALAYLSAMEALHP